MSIKENIMYGLAQVKLATKNHAPEILVGVGIVSIVAGTVLACRATVKADGVIKDFKGDMNDIAEEAKASMDNIQECLENDDIRNYTEQDAAQDKAAIYVRSAKETAVATLKVAKLYAPAAGLIVTGIACVLMSHKILKDRNVALMTAYTALDSAFKAYRARVIEAEGEGADAKYMYGGKVNIGEKEVVDEKTGEVKTELAEEVEFDYPLGSPYARIFGQGHTPFYTKADPNNDFNRAFVRNEERQANDKLDRQGYLFLSDVYQMLGFAETPASRLVGWWKPKNNPEYDDVHVDFGLDLCYTNPDFANLREHGKLCRAIILDFNVNGVIYDKLLNRDKYNDLTDEEVIAINNAKDTIDEDALIEQYADLNR